jgi:hypothetical protein
LPFFKSVEISSAFLRVGGDIFPGIKICPDSLSSGVEYVLTSLFWHHKCPDILSPDLDYVRTSLFWHQNCLDILSLS